MTRAQIVFLIDTNLENCPDLQSSFASSVCLSCLRLLSHLSARFEKCLMSRKAKHSNMNLKWSYKFFNSKVHHTRIESHKMYDNKIRYFEEFENEIQRRIEHKSIDSKMSARPVKAADNICKAFTEILADFKWENQELLSPVKGKRLKKDVSEQINLVFLFTECPKSFLQLKEFTGKKVPDEEILLSSLFPNTLLQQFCKTAKLTLHWIDTHHFTHTNAPEPEAVDIVRKTVERVGGSVTSMHCFARQGCPYFTDIQCLLEGPPDQSKSELSCQFTQLFPLATVISSLSVSSSNTRADRKTLLSKEDTNINIQIGNKILGVSLTSQNVKIRTQQNSTGKIWFPYQSCLHAYAVLRKNCLVPSISIESSYLCVQGSSIDARKNNGQILLEMLISQLATRKSILVLVCSKSGQLVLMEPLTIHTATLSLLSHGTSLSVEKMLLQQAGGAAVQNTDDKNKNCNQIIHGAADSLHLRKENEMEGLVYDGSSFDGRQLGGWVVPGCSRTVQKLFTKLNDRLSELDFLSCDEVETLKQLKKIYRAEKQPPGCRDTTVCNTSHTGLETKTGSMEKTETQQKDRTSQVSLSRVDRIICKSKEMIESCSKKKETVYNACIKTEADKPQLASQLADFKNEDELKNYLTSTYKRLASGEVTDIDSCVQSLTTVALHYFQQKENKVCAKENCRKLLEETLLVSGSQLREKFSQTQAFPLEQKISEYKTQTLLRVEMISSLDEKEKTEGDEIFDEIVGMLRTLSFISEPGFLSKFMQSCFLANYMHTIPQTLASIYDELMQPLPESLANILSPEDANQSGLADDSFGSDVTVDGPLSARTRSHASVEPQSSQPNNMQLSTCRGSRKFVHHYSMSDFGSKRQIVVEKMPKKQNDKSSKRKQRNSSSKRKNEKVTKSPYHKRRGGSRLQHHQSVAVMQRSHKTPKKNEPSSSRNAVTPHRQLSKLVADTPSHKQVSSMLNKTLPELSMDVIKESPEKACDMSHGNTPTKGKRAKALLRRSFYSAGPTKRTKNLSQYFQLANRIAGRQPQPAADPRKQAKLISFETPDHFKSPDKNSSFLLSQLGASPSPAKATPRKLTKTPSKVLDSPCHNTRSKVCQSLSIDIHSLSGSDLCQESPVTSLKQRSCTKKKSPRILAAESSVKKDPVMSQTTPEKSPALGVVTFGLDSPSQNTRQRLAQTPTRRSVRAALFAKSPVSRYRSPYSATASPRALLDKFASPVKSGHDKTTPKYRKSYSSETSENSNYKGAYVNNEPTSAHNAQLSTSSVFSLPNISEVKSDIEVKPSLGSKTPSPSAKKVTKTPESLDKWRRIKSNMSHKSPSVNSRMTSISAKPLSECQQNEMNKIYGNIMDGRNMNKDCEHTVKPVKGSFRTKRSLLESPEKSVSSLSKRQRTMDDSYCSSQGFNVTRSQNDLSQSSTASSVDYFSAMNDDVFLSSDTEMVDSVCDSDAGYATNVSSRKGLLLSDGHGRSQSPVFGISNKKTNISASVGHDAKIKQKSRKNSGHMSPVRALKSPSTKKYSPNVSAKSLMHLIQSPLLHSPEGRVGRKSTNLLSPSSRGIKSKEASSRRSLKLNN